MSGGTGTVHGRPESPRSGVPPERSSGAGPAMARTVRGMAAQWPLHSYLEQSPLPTAIPCFRLHTRMVMAEWRLASIAADVETIVSELATNAAMAAEGLKGSRYNGAWIPGQPPVRLGLGAGPGQVVIYVWDGSDRRPQREDPEPEAPGGRGLLLVESLADRWGVHTLPQASGKVVWAAVTAATGR